MTTLDSLVSQSSSLTQFLTLGLHPLLAQGEGTPLWQSLAGNPLIPLAAIMFFGYLLLIRPERQKRAKMAEMLSNLKKNDRVRTIGGIYGVVVNVTKGDEEVTLRVDENTNTRIRVLRSAISTVNTQESSNEKEMASK